MFKVYQFDSGNLGKNVLFLGAVHGNETAGVDACHKIIDELNDGKLKIISGKVTFIPIVNQIAYKKDVRFIDENLNRVVRLNVNPNNNEQKIAQNLILEIEKNDVMVDLHSTHCKGDVEFAFLDYPKEENINLIELLNVEYILVGWPEIYGSQDNIDDCSTEKFAYEAGKNAITLECGYHKDKRAKEVAYGAIKNVLIANGLLENEVIEVKDKTYIRMKKIVIKNKKGSLANNYKHLDKIKKGETLAVYDDGETLVAENDSFILIPNHEAEVGFEWFYLGYKENNT